jgi:hypothetical protein
MGDDPTFFTLNFSPQRTQKSSRSERDQIFRKTKFKESQFFFGSLHFNFFLRSPRPLRLIFNFNARFAWDFQPGTSNEQLAAVFHSPFEKWISDGDYNIIKTERSSPEVGRFNT